MTPKPLLLINGVIQHDLIEKLFSGEKVVSELNDDDAKVIEQAIFDKFKSKRELIVKDFKVDEERSSKNSIDFTISVGFRNHIFLRLFVQPEYSHYESEKDADPNVKISVYFSNGTDSGNAYGHETDDITRTYKIKRMSNAIVKIEGILDRFIEITAKQRPIYLKWKKEQEISDKEDLRWDLQESFRDCHTDLCKLVEMGEKYTVNTKIGTLAMDLSLSIINKGKIELRKLKEAGQESWIPNDAKKYKNIGVFAI